MLLSQENSVQICVQRLNVHLSRGKYLSENMHDGGDCLANKDSNEHPQHGSLHPQHCLQRADNPDVEERQHSQVETKPEGAEDGTEAGGLVETAGDSIEDVMQDVPGRPHVAPDDPEPARTARRHGSNIHRFRHHLVPGKPDAAADSLGIPGIVCRAESTTVVVVAPADLHTVYEDPGERVKSLRSLVLLISSHCVKASRGSWSATSRDTSSHLVLQISKLGTHLGKLGGALQAISSVLHQKKAGEAVLVEAPR